MTCGELWKKAHYDMGSQYIMGIPIYEYDIEKGNISVLYQKGLIEYETYIELFYMPKEDRNVRIGLMQRADKALAKALSEGFIEFKHQLFLANNLMDNEIQSIRNDAVFVLGRPLQYTEFGNVKFTYRGTYTAYYKLKNIEFYYFINPKTLEEYVEVKGINKKMLPLHENYILEFIKEVFCSLHLDPIEETLAMVESFSKKYRNREVDIGYYRCFNSDSKFECEPVSTFTSFTLDYIINESDKKHINIWYNFYNVISPLFKIVSNLYFSNRSMRRK